MSAANSQILYLVASKRQFTSNTQVSLFRIQAFQVSSSPILWFKQILSMLAHNIYIFFKGPPVWSLKTPKHNWKPNFSDGTVQLLLPQP